MGKSVQHIQNSLLSLLECLMIVLFVVLNLEVSKETSVEEVNDIMKKYALEGPLVEQIKYSLNNELVSSDIVGTNAPSIYDSNATIVSADGKNVVLYVWYDNEFGYASKLVDLIEYSSKL